METTHSHHESQGASIEHAANHHEHSTAHTEPVQVMTTGNTAVESTSDMAVSFSDIATLATQVEVGVVDGVEVIANELSTATNEHLAEGEFGNDGNARGETTSSFAIDDGAFQGAADAQEQAAPAERPFKERRKKPRNESHAEQRKSQPPEPKSTAMLEAFRRDPKMSAFLDNFVQKQRQGLDPNKDGVDHLNASASSKHELGRFLDINAFVNFDFDQLGHFSSIGALWCYLISDERSRDTCRGLYGSLARRRHAKLSYENRGKPYPEGLSVMLALATWVKVQSNAAMQEALLESTLPIKIYHVEDHENDVPQLPSFAGWYTRVLENIRTALQTPVADGEETKLPDFSFLTFKPKVQTGRAHFKGQGEDRRSAERPAQRQFSGKQKPRHERV